MKVKLNGNDWYKVTSDFGNQNPAHSTEYHVGIDLAMPAGTEIESPIEGVVKKVIDQGNEGLGKGIVIKTEDNEELILGHLSEIRVEVGQQISEGDLVALSGNTGNSTGAHLHIGLQNRDGNYIDPDIILDSTNDINTSLIPIIDKTIKDKLVLSPDGSTIIKGDTGDVQGKSFIDQYRDFTDFMSSWKEEGFFQAMYGKSFFEVVKDFFAELFKDIGYFIVEHGDFIFLAPAILIMFGTFLIGRNKWAKWIIPLWFAYFVSNFIYRMINL